MALRRTCRARLHFLGVPAETGGSVAPGPMQHSLLRGFQICVQPVPHLQRRTPCRAPRQARSRAGSAALPSRRPVRTRDVRSPCPKSPVVGQPRRAWSRSRSWRPCWVPSDSSVMTRSPCLAMAQQARHYASRRARFSTSSGVSVELKLGRTVLLMDAPQSVSGTTTSQLKSGAALVSGFAGR